ncbi:DUF4143 domain-containing protein [Xylophilus sp.]|uniref:DUF4143 domain-containing protein n=1 Tax=Xylophilus sp. TaxID=2653893 RepID=UPI002D80EB5F|nr:DUF4143 domain-containing protein [Xylophilus sp.]
MRCSASAPTMRCCRTRVVGASWEGFVVETLLGCAPPGVQGFFYRTSGGAEIDLLLAWPGGALWAVEVKRSLAPKVERGFHAACEDLAPARRIVVYPGQDSFPQAHGITVMPLAEIAAELAGSQGVCLSSALSKVAFGW